MTGVRKPTRILALPILRRNWLYAVEETVEDLKTLRSWREGATLAEKARLGQAQLLQAVHKRIMKQWEDLKSARKGSIKNRLYRLAQAALDQEDVAETFLKALPSQTERYDVIYPSGPPERYVRRRLRLFLRQQEYLQKCRLISWSVAAAPMLPLMVLPLPNIPFYYAGYRVYSHNKALQGCRRLLESMHGQGSEAGAAASSAESGSSAATGAGAARDASGGAPADGTAGIACSSARAAGGAAGPGSSGSAHSGGSAGGAGDAGGAEADKPSSRPALVYLLPEDEVARLVQANKRAEAEERPAVSECAAASIGERLGFPDLPKLLSRMLKGLGKQAQQ